VVEAYTSQQPFSHCSRLQAAIRSARVRPDGKPDLNKVTTLNFDPRDSRVTAVNHLVRLGARILGAERMLALLRYATFLGWQSNYAAVLLNRPFDLEHGKRR
jgi:hypothetical protein